MFRVLRTGGLVLNAGLAMLSMAAGAQAGETPPESEVSNLLCAQRDNRPGGSARDCMQVRADGTLLSRRLHGSLVEPGIPDHDIRLRPKTDASIRELCKGWARIEKDEHSGRFTLSSATTGRPIPVPAAETLTGHCNETYVQTETGVIDANGTFTAVVTKPRRLAWVYPAREGYSVFDTDAPRGWGVLGPDAKPIFTFVDDGVNPQREYGANTVQEGLLRIDRPSGWLKRSAPPGLVRFMTPEGEFPVPGVFHRARAFHRGLAAARHENSSWGFIDRSGRWVIPPSYNEVMEDFETGRAVVRIEAGRETQGIEALIDPTGRVLARYDTLHAANFIGNAMDRDDALKAIAPCFVEGSDYLTPQQRQAAIDGKPGVWAGVCRDPSLWPLALALAMRRAQSLGAHQRIADWLEATAASDARLAASCGADSACLRRELTRVLEAYGPVPKAARAVDSSSSRVSPALQQVLRRVVVGRSHYYAGNDKNPPPPLSFRHVSLSPGTQRSWFRAIEVQQKGTERSWFFITISPGDYQLALEEEGTVVPMFLKPDVWEEGYGPVRVGAVNEESHGDIEDKRFDGKSYVTESHCTVSFVADPLDADSQGAKKRRVVHSCQVLEAKK